MESDTGVWNLRLSTVKVEKENIDQGLKLQKKKEGLMEYLRRRKLHNFDSLLPVGQIL